jgi:hypothetical protein
MSNYLLAPLSDFVCPMPVNFSVLEHYFVSLGISVANHFNLVNLLPTHV